MSETSGQSADGARFIARPVFDANAVRRAFGAGRNGVTIKTEGLTHINLNVRDIKKSLKFYQGAFGLQIRFWEGDRMVSLNTPGCRDTITLCQVGEQLPVGSGGLTHFGFRIASKGDLDSAVKEIERAGGRLLSRGEHGPGHPYLYVADPDGYVIEL